MVKTVKNGKYYKTLILKDHQGETRFEIQNDCSQIRLKNPNDEIYFNCNEQELGLIIDFIKHAIRLKKPQKPYLSLPK